MFEDEITVDEMSEDEITRQKYGSQMTILK
jgi:hypothetical protein